MNDTFKKKVKLFHIPVQFSALVKLFVFPVAAVLSGGWWWWGEEGRTKEGSEGAQSHDYAI